MVQLAHLQLIISISYSRITSVGIFFTRVGKCRIHRGDVPETTPRITILDRTGIAFQDRFGLTKVVGLILARLGSGIVERNAGMVTHTLIKKSGTVLGGTVLPGCF